MRDRVHGKEIKELVCMPKIRLLFILHCNENPIYVFIFWELCGLSPNFHIHVSVSDLYIHRFGPNMSEGIGRQNIIILFWK